MNTLLLIAAGLTVLIAAAHSYLGERYILMRLFRRDGLPKLLGGVEFTKQTLRFAWHITSLAWLGLGGVMILMASPEAVTRAGLGSVVSITFGLTGLIALVASRGRHLSWIVFFAITVLVWVGGR